MLNQAIAAQLNIYNGDTDPGSAWSSGSTYDKLAGDMITEATLWLKTYGGSLISDGNITSSDYNATTKPFALDASYNPTQFWKTPVDVNGNTGSGIYQTATGEDLKNVLMAFNSNKLVTDGVEVAWNTSSTPATTITPTDGRANGPDTFWDLVHDHITDLSGGLVWHG